jgi:hypothetical protein
MMAPGAQPAAGRLCRRSVSVKSMGQQTYRGMEAAQSSEIWDRLRLPEFLSFHPFSVMETQKLPVQNQRHPGQRRRRLW